MLGGVVSFGIVLMKVVPVIPGSFTRAEWIVLAGWCALGLLAWGRGRSGSRSSSP